MGQAGQAEGISPRPNESRSFSALKVERVRPVYPIFNKLSTNSTKIKIFFHNFIIEFVATTDEHFDSPLSSIAALFNSSSTT